jgi:type IV secretion system protein VirB6
MPACTATAANDGVLTNAIGLVDCYTNGFVFDVYTQVFGPGTTFATLLTGALVLYVAIYGIQLALGTARLTLDQFGPRALKIGFIVALLSAWPTFQRLVVEVAFGAPTGIANEMLTILSTASGGQAGVIGAVDAFYDKMMDAAASYMNKADLTNLDYYFAAGFVWIVTILAMFFAFGFLLISKLATALILGVGPIFIALFLFGGTRGLFEGWLRSLVTFALVPMFLLTSLAMLMAMVDGTVATIQAEALAGDMTWDNLVLLMVVTAGFALLFTQIPNVTASIAGGISIGGIAGAMTSLGLGAGSAAVGGGKGIARAGALGYALRSPGARAATIPELQAARRRIGAGIGEQARWWNRVGTTPGMRHAQRSRVLMDASRATPSASASARSTSFTPNRS